MAYNLIKKYRNGAIIYSSNRDIFRQSSLPTDSGKRSAVRYYHKNLDFVLSRLSFDDLNKIYLNSRLLVRNRKYECYLGSSKFLCSGKNLTENKLKAKKRVRDICLNNNFNYFCTLTFADQSLSFGDCVSILQRFCKNYFRRNCGYYVFVPEKHKSGALHFHGLILTTNRDKSIKVSIDSSTGFPLYNNRGQICYNLTSWGFGVSQLVEYTFDFRIINYIINYITVAGKILNRYYYSGGQLIRKPVLIYDCSRSMYDDLVDLGCKSKNICDDISITSIWVDDYYDVLEEL